VIYYVFQETDLNNFKAQLKTKDEEAQQAKKDYDTQLEANNTGTQRAAGLAQKTYEAKLKVLNIQLTAMEKKNIAVQLELESLNFQMAAIQTQQVDDNEAFQKRFEVISMVGNNY
jgi:hypothetical protein